MLLTLDSPGALDPATAGAKAAWLARARQAGFAVLPGVVVGAEHAKRFLERGAAELAEHGSGRARMAITATDFPEELREDLAAATADLPTPLVVRSSSALEGSGLWSGAFTSYLDVHHAELPKAVVGCYASAFTQSTVQRFGAAGISPVAAAMAVLVQPALDPDFGGTARAVGDDVLVVGVKGSPVPLVQGWDPGVQAKVGPTGLVQGASAIDTLGEELIGRVAATLRRAQETIGANTCEWAVQSDTLWLLQVQRFAAELAADGVAVPSELGTAEAAALGRVIRRFPGALGESLVLPWALADPELADIAAVPADSDPYEALHGAVTQAAALIAEVWGRPKPVAAREVADTLRILRGSDPAPALARLADTRPPDRRRAIEILSLLGSVRGALADIDAVADEASAWHIDESTARAWLAGGSTPPPKARIGFDRWEPFNAAIVTAHGASVAGIGAAAGVAFGRMCVVTNPADAARFRPRDVVVAPHPVPGLAALLFDAAAVITTGGSSAAHLFESARSLGIPALCATRIEEVVGAELDEVTGQWALAVDGTAATVHALPW